MPDSPMPVREFSLKLKEIPVMIIGVDGVARPHTIRQLTGEGRDQFNEFQRQRFDKNPDGSVKILNYVDLQAWLIAKMLHDENNRLVPITEVRKYPDETQDGLYELCLSIQEQDGKGIEAAKND